MKKASTTVFATQCGDYLDLTVGINDPSYARKVFKVDKEKMTFLHSEENGAYNMPQNRDKFYLITDFATLLDMAEAGVLFHLN